MTLHLLYTIIIVCAILTLHSGFSSSGQPEAAGVPATFTRQATAPPSGYTQRPAQYQPAGERKCVHPRLAHSGSVLSWNKSDQCDIDTIRYIKKHLLLYFLCFKAHPIN